MGSIHSGGLSQLSLQQYSGFDSETLSGKTQDPGTPQGGASINFGGSSGTRMEDLINTDSQNGGGERMQQMVMSIMQLMLQIMQQMMKAQQGNDSSQEGAPPAITPGTGTTSQAAMESAPTTGTGFSNAVVTDNAPAVTNAATTNTETSSSGISTGESTGLHLPDSMKTLDGALAKASKASGIDAATLAAQVYQESRGLSTASTINGGNGGTDAGLMQVNESTFKELQQKYPEELGSADLSNPADNIMAGAMYMKDMKAQFGGNEGAALRGYNSGPLNVNTSDLSDISKYGTGDATYVDKVQNFANIMKTGEGSLPA